MTGKGHHLSAMGAAIGLFAWTNESGTFAEALHIALGCLAGGKAPDWLELPLWNGQARVIPHRRITHWVVGWICILGVSTLLPSPAGLAVTGFAVGCLVHLSGDLLTPQGVPVIHPWTRMKGASPAFPALTETMWVLTYWAIGIVPYWIYSTT